MKDILGKMRQERHVSLLATGVTQAVALASLEQLSAELAEARGHAEMTTNGQPSLRWRVYVESIDKARQSVRDAIKDLVVEQYDVNRALAALQAEGTTR